MNIIVCLDNKKGMMFNNRRQSRDREVIKDIITMADGNKIWIRPYSKTLFEEMDANIEVSQDPWEHAGNHETVFIEEVPPEKFIKPNDTLIVYKWNRDYPGDVFCKLDLSKAECIAATDFAGKSHETITKEIYSSGRRKKWDT